MSGKLQGFKRIAMVSSTSSDNLWLKLLRQSSTRVLTPEATCVVVGDAAEASLIEALSQQPNHQSAVLSSLELVNYNYLDVDDSALATPTKVHLWQLEESMFPFAKDVLQHAAGDPIMFMIVLDLTTGQEAVESLRKWLSLISAAIQQIFRKITESNAEERRRKILQYLLSARLGKGAVLEASSAASPDDLTGRARFDCAINHFPLPLVVVGHKIDSIDASNVMVMKAMREVQGGLRALCMQAGAALTFCATSADYELSVLQLRRYILHRLYPEHLAMELKIQDKFPLTFIPSGLDTADLIQVSTGCKCEREDLAKHIKESTVVKKPSGEPAAVPPVAFSAIEAEQDWLQGLHSVVIKFSAESGGKSTYNLMDDIQAEADPATAPAPRKELAVSTGSGKETVAAPPTKRASIIRNPNTDNKDVGEFFKNLMVSKPTAKK